MGRRRGSESKKFKLAKKEAIRRLEEASSKGLLRPSAVKILRDEGWLEGDTVGEVGVVTEPEYGVYPETPETLGIIIKPEGATKFESRQTARHEIGHILKGHTEEFIRGGELIEWGDFKNWFSRELGASLTFPADLKHFNARDLIRYTLLGVSYFDLSPKESWKVVKEVSLSKGVPYKTVKKAEKLLGVYLEG